MNILDHLSSAQGRRDQESNIELAEYIVAKQDVQAVDDLFDAVANAKKSVQGDAIKVLYETGERCPTLIAPHLEKLFEALRSKNNRLIWGTLQAIYTVADIQPKALHERLTELVDAADRTTIIGKDKFNSILCKLAQHGYSESVVPMLIDNLVTCAVNQMPKYADEVAAVLPDKFKTRFHNALTQRLPTLGYPAKVKRIEKLLKKLGVE